MPKKDNDLFDTITNFISRHKAVAISTLGGPIVIILLIFVVVVAILSPVIMVFNFFSGVNSNTYESGLTNDELEEKCINDFYITDPSSSVGKTTMAYCKELYHVKEKYKEDYGIEINTTLITATLFYGKTIGEYVNNSNCTEENEENCEPSYNITDESSASSWFNDAEFNKKAKAHVDTLARYMIVRTVQNNHCSTTQSGMSTTPESNEELANTSWWNSGIGGSVRTIENYVLYEGDPSEPGSCPYENDKPKYIAQYEEIRDKYITPQWNVLEELCNNNDDIDGMLTSTCARAQANYESLVTKYYEPQALLGITDSEPGNPNSYVDHNCQYEQRNEQYVERSYDGCAQLPYQEAKYAVDWQRESVYYYKLMTHFTNIFGIESENSFISEYYSDLVQSDNPETLRQNEEEVVDGIYTLYETVANSSGGAGTAGSGDYTTWSQKDPAWGSIIIGTSGRTIDDIGCAATSVAILIAKSGTQPLYVNGEFNPGTFVQAMNANGGFNGGNILWGAATRIAPNFHFVADISNPSVERLRSELEQGRYIAIRVTVANQHWVALDYIGDDGTVYMIDPASENKVLFSGNNYGEPYGLTRAIVYEVTG